MIIKIFETGPLATNCYVVTDESSHASVLIDAPFESAEVIKRYLDLHSFKIEAIVLTHGHWDHTGDIMKIKTETAAPVYYHQADESLIRTPMSFIYPPPIPVQGVMADHFLQENEIISCNDMKLKVLYAPGHTPGHIILYEEKEQVLFTGDVLFNGSIGRTDFPRGNYDDIMQSIELKILSLPDSTIVYPGHGPSTTISSERKYNPFIIEHLEIRNK